MVPLKLVRIFCVFGSIQFVWAQSSDSKCETKVTCGSCIQENGCVWCSLPMKTKESMTRCQSEKNSRSSCPPNYTINPRPKIQIIQDDPLQTSKDGDAVQIKPQRLKLTVRRGLDYDLNFQYTQAFDYPVDLYYLMDLSASMADDRDKLSVLGVRLADVMTNITSNFKMGFGSFVDKVELPFVSTVPETLKSPCNLTTGEKCASPYSFRNHMPLTVDTARFTEEVKKAPVSSNLDSPEGGFDAILQAIVCQEKIGWRPKARHLLVFTTDASFHMAGDGKLAGVVIPNDGKCHLDEAGYYSQALEYDYPSISFINRNAKKYNINLIFAVVKSHADLYKELHNNIEGSEFGALSEDSSNVVELVKGVYEKLVDSVTITDNSGPDIDIKYVSSCLTDDPPVETRECGGIHFGQVVNFTARIKVRDCPANKTNWKHTIGIKPRDLNESVVVELDVICECPCEIEGNTGFEKLSASCSGLGSLRCGVCACDAGRFGKVCECDALVSRSPTTGDHEDCRRNNETTEDCSGRGTCRCGQCHCLKDSAGQELYSGKYCQCNNYSCKRQNGLLCSGRGTCACGQCDCHDGWSGESCDCATTTATCLQAPDKEICSGRGSCECGSCKCETSPERYTGEYCEECPTCKGQRCSEFKDCVECQAYATGKYDEAECKSQCVTFQTEIMETIRENKTDEFKVCRLPDESNCAIVFKYKYTTDNRIDKVYAQKKKECSVEIQLLAVILGVIGTIVLAGLILLLIWKCLTEIHDKREYVKFEKERQLAKWDRGDNPLYKSSISTFKNPTFQQDE